MCTHEIECVLVGQTITGYELVQGGERITFHLLNSAPVTLYAVGDCCSQSWIESIDLPSNLLGKVVSVEDLFMPDLGDIGTLTHELVDVVQYYGMKITTNRGSAVIDYRNDSNGHYGGSLEVWTGDDRIERTI